MLAGQRSAVASGPDNNCNRVTFPTVDARMDPGPQGANKAQAQLDAPVEEAVAAMYGSMCSSER